MVRVLISMTDNFLKEVDALAEREQRTRSELIREAVRYYSAKNEKPIAHSMNFNPGTKSCRKP
jgi:metal-responsive CopG/Arc/MetJ family transcriptional regulator